MKRRFDLLLRRGLVMDGTGSEPYIADVGISGDRTAAIGDLAASDAEAVIPAEGMVVSPGFIDAHAHSDFTLLADPRAEGKILQGVTTEINGNCGMSAAPLHGKALERRDEDLVELGIRKRWNTVREYRDLIEQQGIAVNVAMLAGHGNIHGSVVGYDDRLPRPEELDSMAGMLDDAIREGAIGLSTGLIYPPGIYSNTEELVMLASVLKNHGLIYTSHMRSEGNQLMESVREVIEIGRRAGIAVHISHIKTAGRHNWHKADEVISLLSSERSGGRSITCDRYPYVASSTDLDSILPAWAFDGGNAAELERIVDRTTREKLRAALPAGSGDRDYWERVLISSVATGKNAWMEGKSIAEISGRIGKDEPETVFTILHEEKLRVGAIFMSMSEENLKKFLSLPYCAIGSDSSARSFSGPTRMGKPHPRTFGTFPRFFGRYVRDTGLMPLAEAVRRATDLPATIFGLRQRGRIAEGMFADLVVFDPAEIMDTATFDRPFSPPSGIAHVIVNGIPVVSEARTTGSLPGKMLTR